MYNVVKKKQGDILDDLDLDDIANETEDQLKPKKPGRKPGRKNNNGDKSSNADTSNNDNIIDSTTDFINFSSDLLGLNASMSNIPTTVGQNSMMSSSGNRSQFNFNTQQSSSSPALNNNNNATTDGRSISLDWATAVFRNYTVIKLYICKYITMYFVNIRIVLSTVLLESSRK